MNICNADKFQEKSTSKKIFDNSKCSGLTHSNPTWQGKPLFWGTMFDMKNTITSKGNTWKT